MALRRALRYRLLIPVFRSPHGPEYTARGVANGVFWALTPSVGLQTFQILGTWVIARRLFGKDSSILQALIWVWVNNPFTMIPMYYAFYLTGLWLMGDVGLARGYDRFIDLWEETGGSGWIARMTGLAQAIGLPLVIGCIPYASLGGALSYRWALRVVRRRQQRIRPKPAHLPAELEL
jgi:uncharacterized protein